MTVDAAATNVDIAWIFVEAGGELIFSNNTHVFEFEQMLILRTTTAVGKLTIAANHNDHDNTSPLTASITLIIKATCNDVAARLSEAEFDAAAHGIWCWGSAVIAGSSKTHYRFLNANVGTPPDTGPATPQPTITVDVAPTGWTDGDKLLITDGGPAVPHPYETWGEDFEPITPGRGDHEATRQLYSDDREIDYVRRPAQLKGNEIAYFESIAGVVITLKEAVPTGQPFAGQKARLMKPHFGEALYDPANFQYQRRCEVINLTRNITIKSKLAGDFLGNGHTIFFGEVVLKYCAFVDLGINRTINSPVPKDFTDPSIADRRTARGHYLTHAAKGRYPVHFHEPHALTNLRKNATGIVVENGHFFGIAMHRTRTYKLKDCVVFNVMGHGYYLEIEDDRLNRFPQGVLSSDYEQNEFDGCIVALSYNFGPLAMSAWRHGMGPQFERDDPAVPFVDNGQDHAAGFWLGNAKQKVINCIVVGCRHGYGIGYTDVFGTSVMDQNKDLELGRWYETYTTMPDPDSEPGSEPNRYVNCGDYGPIQFYNNIAHHCTWGFYAAYSIKRYSEFSYRSWSNHIGSYDYTNQYRRNEFHGRQFNPNSRTDIQAKAIAVTFDGNGRVTGSAAPVPTAVPMDFYDIMLVSNKGYEGAMKTDLQTAMASGYPNGFRFEHLVNNTYFGGNNIGTSMGRPTLHGPTNVNLGFGPYNFIYANCVYENNYAADIQFNSIHGGSYAGDSIQPLFPANALTRVAYVNCVFKGYAPGLGGGSLFDHSIIAGCSLTSYWDFINCLFQNDVITYIRTTFTGTPLANLVTLPKSWRLQPRNWWPGPPSIWFTITILEP